MTNLTIDYRNLSKVTTNKGWQILNMLQTINNIGAKKLQLFASADLISGYFKMPLEDE